MMDEFDTGSASYPQRFAPKKNKPAMGFGKYKGEYLEDIPTNYLEWLLTQIDSDSELFKAALKEVESR